MDVRRSASPKTPALLGLEIDRKMAGPDWRRISEQLRLRILNGDLPTGTRLPATRSLARQLGLTRNAIVSAYDDLIGAGLIEGRGRHGTFVSFTSTIARESAKPALPFTVQLLNRSAATGFETELRARFDWHPGQVLAGALPLATWRSACREAGRKLPPSDYGDPQGDLGLRKAISLWLAENRSVRVGAQQIVVTRGTSDALTLLARALVQPGDLCAIEDPGHTAVGRAFEQSGALLRQVAVDCDGICVLQAFEGEKAPLLIHVTPSHQYPTGSRLSGARRKALVAAANHHGTLIVENEYDCEFVYGGSSYPTVYSMAPDITILVGTFANASTPAMRLSFMVAPDTAVTAISALIKKDHLQASWPGQKIMEALLLSGGLDRHIRRSRKHYAHMRTLICTRLAPFKKQIKVSGDEGGLHLVLCGCDKETDQALQRALKFHLVSFQTVEQLTTSVPQRGGFIFAYGHMDRHVLEASINLIEQCLRLI